MSIRRGGPEADESVDQSGEIPAYETTRSANDSSGDKGAPKKEEEHLSVFWRVFGGTILSICALVAITLYNNMSGSITELRAQISHEREARAELVKKDEFNTRVTAQYERMRAIDTVKVELEGMKEKVNSGTLAVDGLKRDTNAALDAMKKDAAAGADAMKKDAAALEVLKERIVLLEGIKKEIAGLDALKERVTVAGADLKVARDEVQKLNAAVERNKASDLERKTLRDSQHKQLEDGMKELQKGIQDCREKLARMEGSQPKSGSDLPIPFGRPADPNKAKSLDAVEPAKPGDVKPAGGTTEPVLPRPNGGK